MTRNPSQAPATLWQEVKNRVRDGLMARTHSARVLPGEVFVALPGTRTSGNEYIAEAKARGAGFVIAQSPDPTGFGGPGGRGPTVLEGQTDSKAVYLGHPDPRQALGELAAAYHGTDTHCPVLVGITGTNGKTTVSYLIEHVLQSSGRSVGVIGTIGARWPAGTVDSGMTTPDCWTLHEILARMHADNVEYVSMEVSSHALEQNRTAGLHFEVAVLTNITQDHLDYHGDMERYFQAKARLFAPDAVGPTSRVINADDSRGRALLEQWPGLGYCLDTQACPTKDCLRGEITFCDRRGLGLAMTYAGGRWTLESPLVGRHNAANLLAAQGVCLCLGLGPGDMSALQNFAGVPGRLERVANAQGLDVFVDYAHTPDALDNVLRALRELDFARLIVVFGCGGDRDRTKRPLMAQAVARWADVAVLTSDNPRHEKPQTIMDDAWPGLKGCGETLREPDRRAAISKALKMMRPGDGLLVAGKGHETTQQIKEIKMPFHDPTVIRELLGCA